MDEASNTDRGSWQRLLDEITRRRRGQLVTLEVLDEERGDQVPAQRLPLDSIGYDPRDDVIVLALSGASDHDVILRHIVSAPLSLDLLPQPQDSLVLQVIDGGEVQTLIVITPEPASAAPVAARS